MLRNIFIHLITISLILYCHGRKPFILAYKFCQKFCLHCPSKDVEFSCIFHPTVLCLLISDNCTKQLFAMILKPPVPQVQGAAAAVGLVLLCDCASLFWPPVENLHTRVSAHRQLKYVLSFRQGTF